MTVVNAQNDEGSDLTACMICGGISTYYFSRTSFGSTWRLRRCNACGHGFVGNRPTLERLAEIYATDVHQEMAPVTIEGLMGTVDAAELASMIASFTSLRGRCLDVGSGNGAFSFHVAKAGFTPVMIDLDPRAQQAVPLISGSSFRRCAFEDVNDPAGFDAVIMSQSLEHSLDPMGWLKHACGLLSPQGVLAIALPNFGGVYRLLGKRDPFIAPPLHLNYFTPRSMASAFDRAGLKMLAINSASRVGIPTSASMKTRLIRNAWNVISKPLSFTSRGIMLRAFARRK